MSASSQSNQDNIKSKQTTDENELLQKWLSRIVLSLCLLSLQLFSVNINYNQNNFPLRTTDVR